MLPNQVVAVSATKDVGWYRRYFLIDSQSRGCTTDDTSELKGLRQYWDELWSVLTFVDVEAKKAGRVDLTKSTKEGVVGGMGEPACAYDDAVDKGGGQDGVEEDLSEEAVVLKHLGYRRH
ncbi:hypothetical protein D1007_56265 [Hordeum vulgare]|nr:hypothetical protein D1007_56265 [Hordeum vulgare]